jgi:hypothetical protein
MSVILVVSRPGVARMGHHSRMRTFGGRRAVTHVSALLVLTLATTVLGGCSDAVDQAHSIQTKLGRIDAISAADVTTPTAERGPSISVSYDDAGTRRELSALIAAIDKIATDADYPSFRLDLKPVTSEGDVLVVDDSFSGSEDEPGVLDSWLTVLDVVLGDITYTFEPGSESIDVDAGAAVAHDVSEASRLRYGFPDTTWTFRNGDTAFVAAGRVSPTDVVLFQDVQRSVSSDVLPAPAPSWRLERSDHHVLLDLDVAFPGAPVDPEQLTIQRYGGDVERLAATAFSAVDVADLPVRMQLRNPTDAGTDVFGYWISDQRPVRGRDKLVRGWDLWLVALAHDQPTSS